MARLSKVGYEQQYKNIIGIRWEFLRRNQDYKRDYQKYGNCKPKDMPLGLFENKYEILGPLDPSIPFFDSIKIVDGYKKKFNTRVQELSATLRKNAILSACKNNTYR